MKKTVVAMMIAALVLSLALPAMAKNEQVLDEIALEGYNTYPLFNEYGELTNGVSLYMRDGTEILTDTLQEHIGKADRADKIVYDEEGREQYIVWSNSGHYAFGQGIRQICEGPDGAIGCGEDGGYVEIVFKGVAINLGTCYRSIGVAVDGTTGLELDWDKSEIKVLIDDEEMETDLSLLVADWIDDTTPTVIYSVDGLSNEVHTLRLYNMYGPVEWEWFQVKGTAGVNGEGYTGADVTTAPEESTGEATTEEVTDEPDASESAEESKKETEAETKAETKTKADTAKTTDKEESSFPVWIPIVAVVVIAAVVAAVVIAKKKK